MNAATRVVQQWLHRGLRTIQQPLFTPDTMPYWLALNCIGGTYCGYQMMEHRQNEQLEREGQMVQRRLTTLLTMRRHNTVQQQ